MVLHLFWEGKLRPVLCSSHVLNDIGVLHACHYMTVLLICSLTRSSIPHAVINVEKVRHATISDLLESTSHHVYEHVQLKNKTNLQGPKIEGPTKIVCNNFKIMRRELLMYGVQNSTLRPCQR